MQIALVARVYVGLRDLLSMKRPPARERESGRRRKGGMKERTKGGKEAVLSRLIYFSSRENRSPAH